MKDKADQFNDHLTHIKACLWDDEPKYAAEALLVLAYDVATAGLPVSIFNNFRSMCINDAMDAAGAPPNILNNLLSAERALRDERISPKSRAFH